MQCMPWGFEQNKELNSLSSTPDSNNVENEREGGGGVPKMAVKLTSH